MAYTPNPLDVTQPTTEKFVETAAAEFRAIKAILANLTSGTGNYAGIWSSLTGPLVAGKVVFHAGTPWLALVNIVDVTASTPSAVNTDWFDTGAVHRTGDVMTGDLTVPSLNGGQLAGFRNKLINGNFSVNQLVVSGTVVLAAGAYGHDCWKAGAAGCTYTFSTVEGITTITISAGSLINVLDGDNLTTGTFTLSWGGTAQGKIGAGAYSSSGVTDSVVGGANLNVEFGTGTLKLVQFEPGSKATPYEHRLKATELWLSQVYYERSGEIVNAPGSANGANEILPCNTNTSSSMLTPHRVHFKQMKKTAPTVRYWDNAGNLSKVTSYTLGGMVPTNNQTTMNSIYPDREGMLIINTPLASTAGAIQWDASARL